MNSKLLETTGLDIFMAQRGWKGGFRDRKIETKAKKYATPGRISKLSIKKGASVGAGMDQIIISADVQGTRKYATSVSLLLVYEDNRVMLRPTCSCPVQLDCKHAYALLEYVSSQLDTETASSSQILQDQVVQSWLKKVENLGGAPKSKPKDLTIASKTVRKQWAPLGFLITPDGYGDNAWEISYMRVIPLENYGQYEVMNPSLRNVNPNAKYLQPEDLALAGFIENACQAQRYYDDLELPEGPILTSLLERLAASQRLFIEPDHVEEGDILNAVKLGSEVKVDLGWQAMKKGVKRPVLTPNYRREDFWQTNPLMILDETTRTLQFVRLPDGVTDELALHWCFGPSVEERNFKKVEKNKIVQAQAPLNSELQERVVEVKPSIKVRITREENRAHYTKLRVSLFANYEGTAVGCSTKKKAHETLLQHSIVEDNTVRYQQYIQRDAKLEKQALNFLKKTLKLNAYKDVERWDQESFYEHHQREYAASQSEDNDFSLPYTPELTERVAEAQFFEEALPVFEEKGWDVTLPKNEVLPEIETLEDDYGNLIEEQDESGIDWFRFDAGFVNGEGAEISMHELLADFISRVDLDTLDEYAEEDTMIIEDPESGKIYRIPAKRFVSMAQKIRDLFHGKGEKMDRVRAAVFADDFQLETSETFRALAELGKKLKSITEIPAVKVPRNLNAEMRPYQIEGFQWLQFLHEHGLNGVLADDMGLGKTLQTIAHLLVQHNKKEVKAPSLVVAPTSVTTNWVKELEKFAPKLKVVLMQGPERHEHWKTLKKYDIVITSYALVVRDEEKLNKEAFHTVVLDEAQYIKNSKAKVSGAVCKLACKHRLCLSGTPLENHLGELWSLTRFLMPGLLGDETSFRTDFSTPIEKYQDSEAQIALTRKIKPLILRRTKEEVATELPKKTEIVNTVTLGEEQTSLYEAIRATMDEKVREAISAKGVSQSQIVFLEALLKLRQTCCDPRLLKDAKQKKTPSAKFTYLTEDLLPTLLEEGRKILIFSQFTTMLGLIEDHFKAENITYCKLTGATRKREEQITNFQEGEAQVFLISLKAGGTGLNLTAADTVIHYDPWWNPAAENQATDRAHRMGQTKPVFVHRLICAGSIEERIQELQKQKSDLADSLLSGSMKKIKLDEKTLGALLAPLT